MSLDFLLDDVPKKGVVLVDFSQIALATVTNTYQQHNEPLEIGFVRHLILETIRYNVTKFKNEGYDKFIFGIDNSTPMYWRRKLAHYYKQSRKAKREESTFDWNEYFRIIKVLLEEFEANLPYVFINIPTIEGDDTIGVLTKFFSLQDVPVLIVSSDSDFTQLHKFKGVKQWSPMHKKYVTSSSGSPKLDLYTKIIKGDKKDTIAGIKVRPTFWIDKLEGERTPQSKAAFVESLVDTNSDDEIKALLTDNEWKRFQENRLLLDFDYIPDEIKDSIMTKYNEYKPAPRGKIYSYFVKKGLSKLVPLVSAF